MNFIDLTQQNLIVLGCIFVLMIWSIWATIIAINRMTSIKELREDIGNLTDELKSSNVDRDAWFKKMKNKTEQADRVEAEKRVLKEKIVILENRLAAQPKTVGPKEEFKNHMKAAPTEQVNSKVGKNTPSRRKDGKFGSESGNPPGSRK